MQPRATSSSPSISTLSERIREFKQGCTTREISQETKRCFGPQMLAERTLENWLEGRTTKIDNWRGLLMFLAVVDASYHSANQLLELAGQPPIDHLPWSPEDARLELYWGQKRGEKQVGSRPIDLPSPTAHLAQPDIPAVRALPVGSRLVLHSNPMFVGRDPELRELNTLLRKHQGVVIAGMPGIGKTQLAVEYAHRYGADYSGGVFWISCVDRTAVDVEIAACGGKQGMNLSADFTLLPLEERVREVKRAWRNMQAGLLIFDNVNVGVGRDTERWLMDELVPPTGGCKVIVTSTKSRWSPILPLRVMRLNELSSDDSAELFMRVVEGISRESALALAEQLGHHPQAMLQAALTLSAYGLSLSPETYLELLRQRGGIVSEFDLSEFFSPTHHEIQVESTLDVTYHLLEKSSDEIDRLATLLLAVLSHFAPGEPVPTDLAALMMKSILPESVRVETVIARTLDTGLVIPGEKRIKIHQLVATYFRQKLQVPVDAQTFLLDRLIEESRYDRVHWEWIPSLLTFAGLYRQQDTLHAAHILGTVGIYLTIALELSQGRSLLQRALAILESNQELEGSKFQIAVTTNGLGRNYARSGNYAEGFHYYARGYAILSGLCDERSIRQQAYALNNMGYIAILLGKPSEAIQYLRESESLRKQIGMGFRAYHANIGLALAMECESSDPEGLHLAYAEIARTFAYGESAEAQIRCGIISWMLGEHQRAELHFIEAISLWEKRFGTQPHWIGEQFYRLANICEMYGKNDAASVCVLKAIDLFDRYLEGSVREHYVRIAEAMKTRLTIVSSGGCRRSERPSLQTISMMGGLLEPLNQTLYAIVSTA